MYFISLHFSPFPQETSQLTNFPLAWAESLPDLPADLPDQATSEADRSNWVVQLPVVDQSQTFQQQGSQVLQANVDNKIAPTPMQT